MKSLRLVKAIMSFQDYPDPDSHCVSVFISGCNIKCRNCSNPDLQSHEFGTEMAIEDLELFIIDKAKNYRTNKICFMGGDPLSVHNRYPTKDLVRNLNYLGYDVCLYTGEEIDTAESVMMEGFKFLKVGRYIDSLRIPSLKTDRYIQFASLNQALYDSKYNLISKNGRYEFKKS